MAVDNTIAGLERQRLELEENVRKLQQSLYHWRLWEAEYDGLKEEITLLKEDSTKDDILEKGREFAGTVVDEKEVKALVGEGQGVTRSRDQVIQLISRRLDYVKQNVTSMEKLLAATEGRLDALLSIERPSDTTTDAEFPVTEIFEELDEDGNVISGRTSTPGDRAPELLQVLNKVGVQDIPDQVSKTDSQAEKSEAERTAEEKAPAAEPKRSTDESVSEKVEVLEKPTSAANGRHSLTTPGPVHITAEEPSDEVEQPVSDVDEPVEDADLRREMLQYGFREVGAVVAELELDEEGSDFSVEDDYGEYDDEEDEEEDEYGRTTRKLLTEEYHQRMRELEKKLNASAMFNVGRDTSTLPEEVRQELEEPGVVKVERTKEAKEETSDQPEEKKKIKKKVAFAAELDIAPDWNSPAPEKIERMPREIAPISESIVERTTSVNIDGPSAEETPAVPKKVSRFKVARNSGAQPSTSQQAGSKKQVQPSPPATLPLFPAKPKDPKPFSQPIIDVVDSAPPRSVPRPPEGKTLAETLVEREISDRTTTKPPTSEPGDEIDEEIHRKEIASEFYRMRNRMVQRNGGFVNDDEQAIVPLDDYEELSPDGQPQRRISKFKAARMRS
jgi:unconventional prefoldin RPB5 interactor 1